VPLKQARNYIRKNNRDIVSSRKKDICNAALTAADFVSCCLCICYIYPTDKNHVSRCTYIIITKKQLYAYIGTQRGQTPLPPLAMASISKRRRNEASIRRFFRYRIETNWLIPVCLRSKRIEKVYSKTFWREEKTNHLILKSSRSKRIEKVYLKTFWIDEKTNTHIPKSSRSKRIKKVCPKNS